MSTLCSGGRRMRRKQQRRTRPTGQLLQLRNRQGVRSSLTTPRFFSLIYFCFVGTIACAIALRARHMRLGCDAFATTASEGTCIQVRRCCCARARVHCSKFQGCHGCQAKAAAVCRRTAAFRHSDARWQLGVPTDAAPGWELALLRVSSTSQCW